MKIALYSDLHLEQLPAGWQPPALDVDVVILAGDIGSHTHGIEWAAETFLTKPVPPTVLYVAGNCEYRHADLYGLPRDLRQTAAWLGVSFLDNNVIEIAGVRFLGTTLWSNFCLDGDNEAMARSIQAAHDCLSDYSSIRKHEGRAFGVIEPRDTIALHHEAAAWLARELAKPFKGKTVVITHFAPHRGCVAVEDKGKVLTPYFTVDMEPLMSRHRIDLWAFGHTHYNVDFVAEYGCRVVSNQRGYPSQLRSTTNDFWPELVIEL